MRRGAFIVLVNGLLLVGLVVLAEAAARAARYAMSCRQQCEPRFLAKPPPLVADRGIGFRVYDPVVGFRNGPGFSTVIDPTRFPEWQASLVTITKDGFRANSDDQPSPDDGPLGVSDATAVIAYGDSYTFGDQVGNGQTWPACLERQLGRPVRNAGVSGYGGAQAMLLMEQSAAAGFHHALTILSVLVGRDFDRDRYAYLNGFPHPAAVGASLANIAHAMPPPAESKGVRFSTRSHLSSVETLVVQLSNWSWLLTKAGERRSMQSYVLNKRTDLHPEAASTDLIARWTLQRFARQPATKLLVLQYEINPPDTALAERELLLSLARDHGISVVDTFSAITEHPDRRSLYVPPYGHHTAAGNELVCLAIASAAKPLLSTRHSDASR